MSTPKGDIAAGGDRPLHSGYSFFRLGRPLWLTSLPSGNSPGVLSFALAMTRALVLSYAIILALFPFFRWHHGDSFDFTLAEGFFFAFVLAFFEDHARWNYVVNAARPFMVAARFAALISIAEFLLSYLTLDESISFLYLICVRASATVLHFLLSYLAAYFAGASQYKMFAVFIFSVIGHAAFNVLGIGYWVAAMLDG